MSSAKWQPTFPGEDEWTIVETKPKQKQKTNKAKPIELKSVTPRLLVYPTVMS